MELESTRALRPEPQQETLKQRLSRARGSVTEKSLPEPVRSDFEARSGYAAGGVRVVESDLPKALGANAVTQGSTIHFPRGGFAPDTAEGSRVLHHELGHTVQQAQGRVRPDGPAGLNESPALEHAADTAAAKPDYGAGHAAGSALSAMPSAGSGAPMQMDKKKKLTPAEEQAMLDQYGPTDAEYQKGLGFFGRRRAKKEAAAEKKHDEKMAFTDKVRASQDAHAARPSAATLALASPDEKGIGFFERHKRARALKAAQKEDRETELHNRMLDMGVDFDNTSGSDQRKMRKQIIAAERRIKKQNLASEMQGTRFVGRMHSADGTLYDPKTRRRVTPGAGGTGGAAGTAPAGSYADEQKRIEEEGGPNLGEVARSTMENTSEKIGDVFEKVPKAVTGAKSGADSLKKYTGAKVPLAAQLDAASGFMKSDIVQGISGTESGVLGGLSSTMGGIGKAKEANAARRAGDTAAAWQSGIDAASSFVGAGNSLYGAANALGFVPTDTIPGIGIVTGSLKTGSSIAQVAGAAHTDRSMAKMQKTDRYAKGYDSKSDADADRFEQMSMARRAAQTREVTGSFGIASGLMQTGAGIASVIPGGQGAATALKAGSAIADAGGAVAGMAMDRRFLNRTMGDAMGATEMKDAVAHAKGAGDLSQKDQERVLAKVSGITGKKKRHQLANRMAARNAVNLHEKIGTGKLDPDDVTLLKGFGYSDPAKFKNISVQMLADKMGIHGGWEDALKDTEQIEKDQAAAKDRALRLKLAKKNKAAADKDPGAATRREIARGLSEHPEHNHISNLAAEAARRRQK